MSPWRFSLLGYPAAWAQPLFLGLVLLALLALVLGLRSASIRQRKLERLVTPRGVPRLAPNISWARSALQPLLSGGGLLLLAVALAQPQCGGRAERVKRRGIDVVVALDASKSMWAKDVAPSRLERAKLELSGLLDRLKGDRVGLVAFAGDAFIQCPLTSDYDAARLFLRAIDPAQMPQGGTNVGRALELSAKVLTNAERGAKEKLVVLLSDGEDLAGEALSAAEGLRQQGIRVLAVGIGSETGEPIPKRDERGGVVDYQRDDRGEIVLTRLDRSGLSAIAEATGGEFFYQPDSVAIDDVALRIDSLQKSELEGRVAVQYEERFALFAWPGFFLWVWGAWLRQTARRRAT
ncbi:MAG: VWA domain-containing protein [Myxococcaceae bacterium]